MRTSAFVGMFLLVCGCASPRLEDCVGQGPDWVVATFGKEKAAEINEIGYSRWVDESVGHNMANGLYKLVVEVGREVTNDTTITVGDFTVIAKEPGEYSFLLEKGDKYEIDYRPFSSNIFVRATDDVIVPPCDERRRRSRGSFGDRDGDGLADVRQKGSPPEYEIRLNDEWIACREIRLKDHRAVVSDGSIYRFENGKWRTEAIAILK